MGKPQYHQVFKDMTNWYKMAQDKKTMIIVRGVSGSGKSTLAAELGKEGVVLSTDDYFYDDEGNYNFDPKKLSVAHKWNQDRTEKAMQNGAPLVVIDNTNVKFNEFFYYLKLAKKYGYTIKYVEPNWDENLKTPEGKWNFNFLSEQQKNKNRQDINKTIPDYVVQRQIDRYQYRHPNETDDDLSKRIFNMFDK